MSVASLFSQLGSAELALFLPVLDQFFTALQQPGVNTQAVAQDASIALLNATKTLPQAESTGISTGAAAAQAALHSLVSSVAPAPAPAPAAA